MRGRTPFERVLEFLAHLDKSNLLPRRSFLLNTIKQLGASLTEDTVDKFKELLFELLPPISWARPPGAVEAVDFFILCKGREGCTACADACENASGARVIKFVRETDSLWDSTPYVDPNSLPCKLCGNFPCATACPTGALEPPDSYKVVSFGRAVVDLENCVASFDNLCRACVEACPPQISAVSVGRNGYIAISAYLCLGCGLCVEACPQEPKGISVIFR